MSIKVKKQHEQPMPARLIATVGPFDSRVIDSRAVDSRAVNSRALDSRALDNRAIDNRPAPL